MASYDWRLEMENMLAAFNHQTMHSLGRIELAFKQSGLSFTTQFKRHFVQASTNCITEAYDRFQVNSMLEKQLKPRSNLEASVSIRSPRNGTNGAKCETVDRQNTIENDGPSNADQNEIENMYDTYITIDGPTAADDFQEIDTKSIVYQSDTDDIITPETDEFDFTVELRGSNDSIDMIGNQNDVTFANDDEFIPMNVVLNRLDETTSAKVKTRRLNRKSPSKKRAMKMKESNEDRNMLTANGLKCAPKQSMSENRFKCTVCEYVGLHIGNLKRHLRTHTAEKPYRCDRCGRSFTNAKSLTNHAATHVKEFPFHCRACFHGFSLKAEAMAHEKQCRKRHYECYLCKEYVTVDKADLTKHMRKHTGIKPFRCEICKKHFVCKQVLKQHLNKIHSRINT